MVMQQVNSLRSLEHDVSTFFPSSDQLKGFSIFNKLAHTSGILFNIQAFRFFRRHLELNQVDIVHFHNLFPLIGPFALRYFSKRNIPVIVTLHNYRLGCIKGTHFRENQICRKCKVDSINIYSVLKKCYRNSTLQSLAYEISRRFLVQNFKYVSRFITLTDFMRDYLKSSISLSPHQSVEVIYNSSIGYSQEAKLDMPDLKLIVFIGRLSEEKGIHNLLRGWDICNLDKSKWKLVIAGSGPNEDLFEKERPGVEFRGMLNTSEVSELLNYSRIVVVPSLWFEGFPLVVSEAAAKGKPVIVSKIGSLGSLELGDWIIKTGVTPEAIAETLNGLDGVDLLRIGRLAREWHKNQGYQELQIRKLVDVYKSAIKNSH